MPFVWQIIYNKVVSTYLLVVLNNIFFVFTLNKHAICRGRPTVM